MILVAGAGFLGSYLIKYLSENTDENILAVSRNISSLPVFPKTRYFECDMGNQSDVSALAERCGGEKLTVFYLAAMHSVDRLFLHPDEGRKINIDALSAFLKTVPDIEKLFFASTDCVYGENPPGTGKFMETDRALPINEYGRQKLEAEKIVRSYGYTSVRFAYMLGKSLISRPHFYDNIAQSLSRSEPVYMIDGMVRSSLSYKTAAELLAKLSFLPAGELPSTVNLCSDGEYSKYDLGLYIARGLGFSSELIKKISEKEAESFFKEKRASRIVMDNSLLKTLLGIESIALEE
ncbi:MAG: NAD(P)-dependent oxidoreductase [Oscillospiraceae bacterium]|nr:NAD(P)-dependent oxidoreductase [Oscillospiraceae bacterium]